MGERMVIWLLVMCLQNICAFYVEPRANNVFGCIISARARFLGNIYRFSVLTWIAWFQGCRSCICLHRCCRNSVHSSMIVKQNLAVKKSISTKTHLLYVEGMAFQERSWAICCQIVCCGGGCVVLVRA